MTCADRFMRTSIKRRLSLTTLLQISKTMKGLTDREIEARLGQLDHLLETSKTEQEFCLKVFGFTDNPGFTDNSDFAPVFFTEKDEDSIQGVRTLSSERALNSRAG